MSETGLSPNAIVGVGAGIGTLFFCAASFVVFQIFRRRQEHKREMAEIERGSLTQQQQLPQMETAQAQCHLPFMPIYNPYGGWNNLSSNDMIHQLPPFGNVPGGIHPSFMIPEAQPKPTWNFSGRRPRIGRIPSKARGLKTMSAIMESPRGTPNGGGSRNSPAGPTTAKNETNARPGATEVPRIHIPCVPTPSPKVLQKSTLRPTLRVEIPVPSTKSSVKELSRPRTGRSKSLGAGSADNKRASALVSSAPGPAPTGPLPPLPPLPRNIQRQGHYDPANRHSALGIPSSGHAESASTSLSSSPERNWERILSTENLIPAHRARPLSSNEKEMHTSAGAETGMTDVEKSGLSSTNLCPQPLSIPNQRNSMLRMSVTSNSDKHNSWSSVAESLKENSNRLSVPQIVTADRVSMSRVSSSNSLKSMNNIHMVSTPKHRSRLSKVSASGSPAERPKSKVLRKALPKTPTPSPTQTPRKPARTTFSPDTAPQTAIHQQHSILKGSPGARTGTRPQTCVRLSTLSPIFMEPGHRSANSSCDSNIYDYSPVRGRSLVADKHMNGDVTLRPRSAADVTRWRAALASSPPPLPMPTYHQEPSPYDYNYNYPSRPTSSLSQRPTSSLSRQSSIRSVSSLPSMSHFDGANYTATPKPTLSRQTSSTEMSVQERTPAFGLHVTPGGMTPSWQQPRTSQVPPTWSRQQQAVCT